jgi:uncharacterized FlaG/YvyC family protein
MNISSAPNSDATAAVTEAQNIRPLTQDQKNMIKALKAVNAAEYFGSENELTFVMDRATHKAVVRIINKSTHEVVDQIPSEVLLRMAEDLKRTE